MPVPPPAVLPLCPGLEVDELLPDVAPPPAGGGGLLGGGEGLLAPTEDWPASEPVAGVDELVDAGVNVLLADPPDVELAGCGSCATTAGEV